MIGKRSAEEEEQKSISRAEEKIDLVSLPSLVAMLLFLSLPLYLARLETGQDTEAENDREIDKERERRNETKKQRLS